MASPVWAGIFQARPAAALPRRGSSSSAKPRKVPQPQQGRSMRRRTMVRLPVRGQATRAHPTQWVQAAPAGACRAAAEVLGWNGRDALDREGALPPERDRHDASKLSDRSVAQVRWSARLGPTCDSLKCSILLRLGLILESVPEPDQGTLKEAVGEYRKCQCDAQRSECDTCIR